MLGVEIASAGNREEANRLAEAIMYHALSGGLSFKITMGNILLLVPPLTITDAEMDEALLILESALRHVNHQRLSTL